MSSPHQAAKLPFRLQSTTIVTDILRVFDVVVVVASGIVADVVTRGLNAGGPGFYYAAVLVAGLVTPWLFSQSKAYVSPQRPADERWIRTAAVSLLKLTLILAVMFAALEPNTAAARTRFAIWMIGLCVAVLASRIATGQALKDGQRSRGVGKTIAIVGANASATRIIDQLSAAASAHYPIELLGVFDDRTSTRHPHHGPAIHGSIGDLIAKCLETPVHHVVLALPCAARSRLDEIVDRLKALAIEVTVCPDDTDASFPSGLDRAALGPLLLVPLARPPLSVWDRASKRILDWTVALLVILFLAPILVVICIAIRLDSAGPILFRQKRNGLNGREFVIYKFRSMFVEAADELGARQTELNDKRITRVGRILRASSLDELPQLFNVLEGTMSLVGPRPHPVGMRTESLLCEEISPRYAHRHQVKPGITGWAQVHGCRGATTTTDELLKRIAFDIDYVERWSLLLDFRILILTPALLFLGERPKAMASSAPNRIAALALVCLASLLGSHGGSAATYYVSAAAGSDVAAGTSRLPWRTLKRSVRDLKPGDRLVVRAGRYAEPMVVSVSGTPQRPIELIGAGRPLVEAEEDAVSLTGSYLLLEGFEAHSSGWGSAIAIGKNNHHVRVVNNLARDSACGGVSAVQTDYLTVEDNRVFGNARRAPWQCSGISIYEAVAQDHTQGFHNVIQRNIVYDNMNIFVDDAVSHSNGKTTDGNGIIVDDNDHSQNRALVPAYTEATLIRDNQIFDNGGRGVHVFKSSNVVVMHNVAFHNLKDANLQRPAAELSAAFSRNVKMFDNIAVARGGEAGLMDAYPEGRDTWDYNWVVADPPLQRIKSDVTWGAHNVVGRDPGFIRADIGPIADFRLAAASPAKGAGAVVRLGGAQLAEAAPASRSDPGLTSQ